MPWSDVVVQITMHDLPTSTAWGFFAVCTTAAITAGTMMLVSRRMKTDPKAVKAAEETLQRKMLALQKRENIIIASNHNPNIVHLLLEIFQSMNELQLDKGDIAKRLRHLKPVIIKAGDNATELVRCRNLCTLRWAANAMCSILHPFVAAIDPFLGPDDNKFHAFILLNSSKRSAIVVRISDDI